MCRIVIFNMTTGYLNHEKSCKRDRTDLQLKICLSYWNSDNPLVAFTTSLGTYSQNAYNISRYIPEGVTDIPSTTDLALIDKQSARKRSLHLMDTVNTKKRWTTIYWRVNNFWKRATKLLASLMSEHHFWKLMTFHFLERLTAIIVVL
jgi:hypothetical protein